MKFPVPFLQLQLERTGDVHAIPLRGLFAACAQFVGDRWGGDADSGRPTGDKARRAMCHSRPHLYVVAYTEAKRSVLFGGGRCHNGPRQADQLALLQ